MELTKTTAQDIVILALAHPKDKLSELIARMPHNTIFVIAGLFYARQHGTIEFDFVKDKIKVLDANIVRGTFDANIITLADTIQEVVAGYAEDETDVTINHIQQWAGTNPNTWTIVRKYIEEFKPDLAFYLVEKSKKEKYEFICLAKNADKHWGERLK